MQPTRIRNGSDEAIGIFLALTGALIATSFLTIGESGAPLFFLALLLPFGTLVFGGTWSPHLSLSRRDVGRVMAIGCMFLLLAVTCLFQFVSGIQAPSDGLVHAITRLFFLVYWAISIIYLRGECLRSCAVWLRRILIVLALYGIYQIPAKILGFPLFLDWLRNNHSFDFYDYNTAGWVSLVRVTSVYAEPSQCAVPALVLFLLNLYVPSSRFSRRAVWWILLFFSALTFSRTLWVTVAALLVTLAIVRVRGFSSAFKRHHIAFGVFVLAVSLLFPTWAFLGSNYKSDFSRQERAGSIVIGLHLVMQHPIVGSGWNSFNILVPSYQLNVEGANPYVQFRFIHNMFVSDAQQAGIPGLLFALFPLYAMIFMSEAPLALRLGSALPLLVAAELGGDVAYASLYWLWVAIVMNWPSGDIQNESQLRDTHAQPVPVYSKAD